MYVVQLSHRFMLIPKHRVRHKRFNYEPRFYDPKADEDLKNRLRIKRKAYANRRDTRQRTFIIMGILLLMALYIYTRL